MPNPELDAYAKAYGLERPKPAPPADVTVPAVGPVEWPTVADPQARRGICPGCGVKKLEPRDQTWRGQSLITILIVYPAAACRLAENKIGTDSPITQVMMFGLLAFAWYLWRKRRRYLECQSCARQIELG